MSQKSHHGKSALKVQKGIEPPPVFNPEAVSQLKKKGKKLNKPDEYLEGLKEGNRMILGKAITLIESSFKGHLAIAQEIIDQCLPLSGNSVRIGITGVPGAGKSTFIEALGTYLTSRNHKVAVLAIDPSSERTKGSILGDKTRMEKLANNPNAFIRPSPSAGSLGGVARKTKESIILCEAAGFDIIIIETVGVGQSEITVHSMVDFFLLLMLAGAGDELQGIKRGIMEMADMIVINKADGDNMDKARLAGIEYAGAVHLFAPSASGWTPQIDICSSLTGYGIDKVWETIEKYRQTTQKNGYFLNNRNEQNRNHFYSTLQESLLNRFYSNAEISGSINAAEQEVVKGKSTPFAAVQQLLDKYPGY